MLHFPSRRALRWGREVSPSDCSESRYRAPDDGGLCRSLPRRHDRRFALCLGKAGKDYVIQIERVYRNDFFESAFEPAAWMESKCRGIAVGVVTPDDYPKDPVPPEHLRP
jgi:hypothetical protein